jgi:cytoskeletal protein RodZ
MLDKKLIFNRLSSTEERVTAMEEVVKKFVEEVEQYKGLVSKVAAEFQSLKDKLGTAVDEESWKAVSAVVAELDATNAKLEELVTVKAPDPTPVIEEPAPIVDTPVVEE